MSSEGQNKVLSGQPTKRAVKKPLSEHWYFKVICACGGKMTGECDKHPGEIVRIFGEVHGGTNHYMVVRIAQWPLVIRESIAAMRDDALSGLAQLRRENTVSMTNRSEQPTERTLNSALGRRA